MSSKSCLAKVIAVVLPPGHCVNTQLFDPEQQTAKTPVFIDHSDVSQLISRSSWLLLFFMNLLEAAEPFISWLHILSQHAGDHCLHKIHIVEEQRAEVSS
ncbi:hypothetical protein XENOCAPTIV_011687 [Xenoophorus captivus]|uniref:Uncharacterized protein n=1 Tax=Xenoophorus captivus TaxID=1517983 RepID=A0ABV0QA64_9TELE